VWEETVQKPYNVLDQVRALDAKEPGFLKTYGVGCRRSVRLQLSTRESRHRDDPDAERTFHRPLAQATVAAVAVADD